MKSKTQIYYDRNTLAFAFLRLCLANGIPVGWRMTDDKYFPAVVAELDAGEVGWHVPRDQLEPHRSTETDGWLPLYAPDFQGYSRDVKNERLQEFAKTYPLSQYESP